MSQKDPLIRNARMLADHIGANYDDDSTDQDLEEAMSHRIYKDTSCGAWLALREIQSGKRREVWSARLMKSIVGIHASRVRRVGQKRIEPQDVPDYIRQFLDIQEGLNSKTDIPVEIWQGLSADYDTGGHILKVTQIHPIEKVVTFWVERPVYVKGVAVGSIVEGCDAEVMPEELTFPFRSSAFWKMVQNVEDEADRIWKDTHGCETCEAHWIEEYGDAKFGEYGGIPAWDECPECNGDGAVI